MGNIGWSGIIIVAVLVVLLFGRGKISSIMGDVAKGIKSFKKGMSDSSDQASSISSPSKEASSEEASSEEASSEETSSEDQNSEKK